MKLEYLFSSGGDGLKVIRNTNFELIKIADENLAIPIGDEATKFHGVVTLSEPAAFLLNILNRPQSVEDLVENLINEYEVDEVTAERDIKSIITIFRDYHLILDT